LHAALLYTKVILDGQPEIIGAVTSLTVTVKLHNAVQGELVAVNVTVVTPLLNVLPDADPLPLPVVAPVRT
jgi:hypothetical protein